MKTREYAETINSVSEEAYKRGFRSGVLAALEKVPGEKSLERISNAMVIHDHDAQIHNSCREEAIKNIKGLL